MFLVHDTTGRYHMTTQTEFRIFLYELNRLISEYEKCKDDLVKLMIKDDILLIAGIIGKLEARPL